MSGCDLYLRVRSRPIIEHCSRLRFAPLVPADVTALGLSEAAAAAGLASGGGSGGELWRAVDDFGWVKATASPNWAVMPEGERRPVALPPQQQQQQQQEI
jgi:hypothetical protein